MQRQLDLLDIAECAECAACASTFAIKDLCREEQLTVINVVIVITTYLTHMSCHF